MRILFILFVSMFLAEHAAAQSQESATSQVANGAVAAFFTVVAGLVTAYGPRLMRGIEKRFNIDIPDGFEYALDQEAQRGVAYVEEQTHKRLKAKLKPLESEEKLEMAAEFILETTSNPRIRQLARRLIMKRIEAFLSKRRHSFLADTVAPLRLGEPIAKEGYVVPEGYKLVKIEDEEKSNES